MSNSIQWPKVGDVLGDFILDSAAEITTARARFLATHEPTNQKALIVCGASELDARLFVKKTIAFISYQFRGAARVIDANGADGFHWIAHEYLECQSLPAAVKRKLILQNSLQDLGRRIHLSIVAGLGIASTLERFYEAGFVHGELDPFRTALALHQDQWSGVLFETGFAQLFEPDFDRIRAHPLFCAPEQLHGHPPSMRADIYACAMIMRFLMLGSPFSNDPDQLLRQCQQERPAPLKQSWPNLERLSNLMDAALEKDPANRPKDWDEFIQELTLFLAEMGVSLEEEIDEPPDDPFASGDEPISVIPAKSKIHVPESVAPPMSANKERLAMPSKGMRAGVPMSIIGRAGKTREAYFQAPSECGAFRIAEVIDGQGALQRFRAREMSTEKEALLACVRAHGVDQDHFERWMEKRAALQIKAVAPLLGGGVDGDLCFIGEERGGGVRLEDTLPGFEEAAIELRRIVVAGSAAIVTAAMNECAQAGFFHGNLDPRCIRFEARNHFALTLHEIGLLQGLGIQSAARGNPYAAPEVREGKAWDHRADIFSYAMILHEQLTGSLAEALGDEWKDVRLGHALMDVIVRGLAADPEKRFSSWVEFRDAVNMTISPELRRFVAESREHEEQAASKGDEADSSGESARSSANGSEPVTSGVARTVEPATRPWKPPSLPAMTPSPMAARTPGDGRSAAFTEQAEPARPSSKKPQTFTSGDPIPSTLRSEGVRKERGAVVLARSAPATLIRWTPSPMKVYERSPMIVFTRSPIRVRERSPLALRGALGKLMRFSAVKDSKPLKTVLAALAVAAVGVLVGAGILSRAKPSVFVANSIEMAIPELHSVRAKAMSFPVVVAPLIEKTQPEAKNADDKSAEPKAGDNSKSVSAVSIPKAPKPSKSNSPNTDPKQSSPRKHFIYGETAGTDPGE